MRTSNAARRASASSPLVAATTDCRVVGKARPPVGPLETGMRKGAATLGGRTGPGSGDRLRGARQSRFGSTRCRRCRMRRQPPANSQEVPVKKLAIGCAILALVLVVGGAVGSYLVYHKV